MDEAGVLRSGRVVLSRPSALLRPPPTPSRPPAVSRHLRLSTDAAPIPRRDRAEEGLPSSQNNSLTVPRPIHREVPPHPLQDSGCVPWPSPCSRGLGSSLTALTGGEHLRRRRLRLMLRTGQLIHPASNPASQRRTEVSLPGTLASPGTGLSPASCPELTETPNRPNAAICRSVLGAHEHVFA
jgi:hypothetical protein